MKQFTLPIIITEAQTIAELPTEDQQLITLSRNMTDNAYAPYSEFFVGAAILLENGEIVKGSNQENAAYPSGLCAERVAVFAASAIYPEVKIKTVAISAKTPHHVMDYPVSPCGACRQALLEYEIKQNQPIRLLLSGVSGKILVIDAIRDLLPLCFSPKDLGKK
jgi:cytidine deaminase